MTFQETLERHLKAITDRDLDALADTLADEELTLITAEGRLVRSTADFLDLHRGWFASPHWKLEATPVQLYGGADLGVAVLHLDYREAPPGMPRKHEESYLTLVFQARGDKWVMVQDQNTPSRAP